MKQTAAILLSAILLFNWAGYRLLLSYMRNESNIRLDAQLDQKQYDSSELISVKVSAPHLSSYSLSGRFERISGQVSINGIQYQYVKKRLFGDSLEYICIPNHVSTQLLAAQNDFFKQVTDLRTGRQEKKPGSFTSPSNEFSIGCYFTNDQLHPSDPDAASVPVRSARYFVTLPPGFSLSAEQPPDPIS